MSGIALPVEWVFSGRVIAGLFPQSLLHSHSYISCRQNKLLFESFESELVFLSLYSSICLFIGTGLFRFYIPVLLVSAMVTSLILRSLPFSKYQESPLPSPLPTADSIHSQGHLAMSLVSPHTSSWPPHPGHFILDTSS